jgi:uroporphyrin-3 C-methyltransferase
MTDKKSEIPPIVQASASDNNRTQASGEHVSADADIGLEQTTKSKSRSVLTPVLLVLVLASAGFTAYVWQQQRQALSANIELSARLQRSVNAANQAAERAQQALSKVQDQAGQIALLETSLRDAIETQQALEQAFQTLTDKGSDLVLINDIDHLVTIAQQQLQLGGNVANAIISMETAQSQLARANRPSLAALQQTINGDLERLRAASTVDVSRLSGQLDTLNRLLADAPLLLPDDAAPAVNSQEGVKTAARSAANTGESTSPVPAPAADAAWWEKSWYVVNDWSRSAWGSVAHELTQLISVRRVDDSSALLMSPEQSARFRDNLRLRIMTAQLALMMRQPSVWDIETKTLLSLVSGRFDPQSDQVRQALKIAQDLADTSIALDLPRVDNSLRAIESLREESASSRQEQDSESSGFGSDSQNAEPTSNDPEISNPQPEDQSSPILEQKLENGMGQGEGAASNDPINAESAVLQRRQGFVVNTEDAMRHAVRTAHFVQRG